VTGKEKGGDIRETRVKIKRKEKEKKRKTKIGYKMHNGSS